MHAPEPRTTLEYAIATYLMVGEIHTHLARLDEDLQAQRTDVESLKAFRTQVKAILAPLALVGGPIMGAIAAWLLHARPGG